MNQPLSPIGKLHETWNKATGQRVPLGVCSYEIEHGWHQFVKAGFTESDLLAVVRYLQSEIRKGERKEAALRWRNCIGDTLRFAEELELAWGAERRFKKPTPKQVAIEQLRPTAVSVTPQQSKQTAVPVSELINNLKKAAGMTL